MIETFFFLALLEPVYGQITEDALLASDGLWNDYFGESVSISGNYAVVGAVRHDDNGLSSGSAYVYRLSEGSWIEEMELLASDGVSGDSFGKSVSISGDHIIVGSFQKDDNGDASGAAYVFKRTGIIWTEEAILLASDGVRKDYFGYSVSISSDYAVVGAPRQFNSGDVGTAYVFHRSDSSWTEEAKLVASDGAEDDQFGITVAISGDYVVVGSPGDDDNGFDTGSAYIFNRDGTSWTQEAKLLASDGYSQDSFGWSVSISGDHAIVGAIGDSGNTLISGSAYVYHRSGKSWTEEARLIASDGDVGDRFGRSVSISDTIAIIGASNDDARGWRAGSAYLFKRSGASWSQISKIESSVLSVGAFFGWSVSIFDGYVIVGAIEDDGSSISQGSAFVYSNFASLVGVIYENTSIPKEFVLSQNYPNPFNPGTMIEYSLPRSGEVSLIIYNLLGKEVTRLVDKEQSIGKYQITWNASNVSSGIYFYRLQAGGFVQTRKMVLLK